MKRKNIFILLELRLVSEHDFIFVLPSVDIGLPPGGAVTIYFLARRLRLDGYRVSFIYLKGAKKYLNKNFANVHSRISFFDVLQSFPRFASSIISPIYRRIKNIGRLEYEKEVYFKSYATIDQARNCKQHTKNLIACEWISSFFVKDYSSERALHKYRIINHSEEDKSFNPDFSELAAQTYNFPIEKIVYNNALAEKFQKEGVLQFKYGYDVKRFFLTNAPESRETRTLLIPLRQGKEKGSEFALKIIQQIKDLHTNVRIVTFGNFKGKLPEGLEFHFSPTEDLNELYNQAAVFFIPSIVEGFSLPTIEAMACGCAVVCIKNEGTTEYIRNGFNGIFVDHRNYSQVTKVILELLGNNKKRVELANNAMETATKYTSDEMYESFKSLFV